MIDRFHRSHSGVVALGLILLMVASPCAALVLPLPKPINIPFHTNQTLLDRAGIAQVDRLAVRAASCDKGPLQVNLWHDASLPAAAVAAHEGRIKARLQELGVKVMIGSRSNGRGTANVLQASVRGGSDEYCFSDGGPVMMQWVTQIETHLARPSSPVPVFWRAMSPGVRDGELALPLAGAALCRSTQDCTPRPAVFWWLVSQVAVHEGLEQREAWQELLWEAGSEEDLQRLEAMMALEPLALERKAILAPDLAQGTLPWPTIERRLLEPGVMTKFAAMGDDKFGYIFNGALRRNELTSFGRLLDAAESQARACYVANALTLAVQSADEYSQILPHLAEWVHGTAAPSTRPAGGFCDVTDMLLVLAACGPYEVSGTSAQLDRARAVWREIIGSGFTPDEAAVQYRLQEHQQRCRLERADDPAFPFRRAGDSH